MRCPYCNHEMHAGYLQSQGNMLWGPRRKRWLFTAFKEDEFYLYGENLFGSYVDSHYCPKCKKLIVDVSDSGYEVVESTNREI